MENSRLRQAAPTAVNVTVGDAAPRQYLTEMLARPRINEMQIA